MKTSFQNNTFLILLLSLVKLPGGFFFRGDKNVGWNVSPFCHVSACDGYSYLSPLRQMLWTDTLVFFFLLFTPTLPQLSV